MRKKFGEVLVEQGAITPGQLRDALALQRRRGMRLGAALVNLGHLSETQLVDCLSGILQIPIVDLTRVETSPEAMALVKGSYAADHELFPYALQHGERNRRILSVAMSDPLNVRVIDELSFVTNSTIEPRLARPTDIDAAIRKHYGGQAKWGPDLRTSMPMRLPSDYGSGEMTIVRRGGGEEVIDTTTGSLVSPFYKGGGEKEAAPPNAPAPSPSPASSSLPPTAAAPQAVPQAPRAGGAPAQGPIAGVRAPPTVQGTRVSAPPPPLPGAVRPLAPPPLPGAASAPPLLLTDPVAEPGAPDVKPTFDSADLLAPAALVSGAFETAGALMSTTGATLSADSIVELEQKFWALMRILARKGLLTREEFMAELQTEAFWRRG